ncbi:FtsQ-type POTRA domain-containing protein [Cyanobacterium aponinum UTEX 3222]|uniref:FtsQ-type POTRA domain-containing protein n=1 Tax=Cyanobacterium aponinum AL20115 TaxID=3090662 RepID=A0AAF0ZD52_9CHRO|nr:FtsQ-type POTRA domain-containing protein [Cyanobacterium aponinum]WPF89475.1 FtsQ-type POTRA domain-containing protein [Cyanobacterium aponinum AL20115]WRL38279.1 FtsQ-type POTRA domain-containing protein [Cyanobacterium aponinum UTEX 3221]WRL41236.1 FtsQ-type POTRA domain-containing protein [Cyanobacterium aponinum UTEX 3222]
MVETIIGKSMANQTFVSTTTIRSRREERKKERRWRDFIAVVRFLMILSLTGGVFWFITLPNWVIKNSQQIDIEGNSLLSDDEVRSLIPLQYPQSLLKLSTQELGKNLQTLAPVNNVVIQKELFPPHLKISLEEKKPVAIALAPEIEEKTNKLTVQTIGYLDEDGVFVSNEVYHNLKENPEQLPTLKIIGAPQTYLPYWQELYGFLTQSTVKINTVDWQNPTNLVLLTDLGKIYLGAYTPKKFPQQLMVLEKLKVITAQVRREDIIYIDLTDPEIPSISKKEPVKEEKNSN